MAQRLDPSDSNDLVYEIDGTDQTVKFDLSDRVTSDMLKMFREGTYNDVCIKLHDGEIKANKFILAARCEYFAASFRWKNDNNHEDMAEVVIKDCSKKIMSLIIEYIFSGILKIKDLKLLEFLEMRDQVRKMYPGDKLEGKIETLLKDASDGSGYYRVSSVRPSFILPPTNEEIVKAVSRVETGNLQPEVLMELTRTIESHITKWNGSKLAENTSALSTLVSCGVIESVQNLELNLRNASGNLQHLQTLVSSVSGELHIDNIQPHYDITNTPYKHYDLETLLDSANCKVLYLFADELNQEETEALVRSMSSRIKMLHLSLHPFFRLDYDAFSKYTGDGTCTEVHIANHSDYHLSPLLDSVNCQELHLFTETKELSQKETEALVRAMTSRVEIVHLGRKGGHFKDTVTLDFDTLTKYKGDGKCREVHCNNLCIDWSNVDDPYYGPGCEDFDERGRGNLITTDEGYAYGLKDTWMDEESAKTWAEKMNWDIKVENQDGEFLLARK